MSNTLMQGLVLLVAGMGIVYVFLALMVWVMNRFAVIIPRFNHILPDEEPKKKTRAVRPAAAASAGIAAAPAADAHADGQQEVRSVLPGAVLRVGVKTGDIVAQGDELLALDVMKMETPVRAPRAGCVASVRVGVGDKVNTGDLLAVLA
ncbi:MAG: OadG family protein [Kiritimatiellae bacterium]|nr:OadG family protein [Kiritimatiellia bacterium]